MLWLWYSVYTQGANCPIVYTGGPVPGVVELPTPITPIRLTATDKARIADIQKRYDCKSATDAIKIAIYIVGKSPTLAPYDRVTAIKHNLSNGGYWVGWV